MSTAQVVVAGFVLVLHGALLVRAFQPISHAFDRMTYVEPVTVELRALPSANPTRLKVPVSEIHFLLPLDLDFPTNIQFVDLDADLVKGVTAPVSAPRIDESLTVDSEMYARRAGLGENQAATVTFAVEVKADGSAGRIDVTTSSGDWNVDREAMAYLRALRWIPGSVNRHAQPMRVQWTITLSAS